MSYSRIKGHGSIIKPGCSIDWSHALSRDLVCCWLFNEGAGGILTNYVDFSTASLKNMDLPWVGSNRGGGLNFDGSDDYCNFGSKNYLSDVTSDVSVVVSFRAASFGGRFCSHSRPGTNIGFGFGCVSGGNLKFTTFGVKDYTTSGLSLQTNLPYHAVAVLDGSFDVSYYVDGVFRQLVSHTVAANVSSADFYIGASTVLGTSLLTETFSGVIDEVRIYRRSLSYDEVKLLYFDSFANFLFPLYRRFFVSGGTAFTQDISGAITFTGLMTRKPLKLVAGASTFAGVISRIVYRSLVAALSFDGVVSRITVRGLAGVLTFVGDISSVRFVPQAVSGVISFSGDLVRKALKALVSSVTFLGVLSKVLQRSLSGVLSLSGDLVRKALKVLASSVFFDGALDRLLIFTRSVSGAIIFSGDLVRMVLKSLLGSVTFSGALSVILQRVLSGTLTFAGNLSRLIGRFVSSAITFVGSLSTVHFVFKVVSGVVTFVGTVATVLGEAAGRFKKLVSTWVSNRTTDVD